MDYEHIRVVILNRAASERLLYCRAMVCCHGQERWQKDYSNPPTGPLEKYKIKAVDATDSCVMSIRLDHMEGLQHVEKLKLCKCHYIKDDCLETLGEIETLPKNLLEVISCGNITDKGIICIT